MLTSMRLKNFKCWEDTGEVELSRITMLFGANSSGKSSIIQALLLLKQSANSRNKKQILNFGSDDDPVRLGSFDNVIFSGDIRNSLEFQLEWEPIHFSEIEIKEELYKIEHLKFKNKISSEPYTTKQGHTFGGIRLNNFTYSFHSLDAQPISIGMESIGVRYLNRMIDEGFGLEVVNTKSNLSQSDLTLDDPNYFFSFPEKLRTQYQNTDALFGLEYDLNVQLDNILYLGPLRSEPKHYYSWTPDQGNITDIGFHGENAIHVLLANKYRLSAMQFLTSDNDGEYNTRRLQAAEVTVASWLEKLGLIESFEIIKQLDNLYSVDVQTRGSKYKTSLSNVGFGISQILPVLVLCATAAPGSTLLLEEPEMHLHPKAQSALADIFIDAIKFNTIQIIVESHSEHLLTRLQRRMAEGELSETGISYERVRTYFCEQNPSKSILKPLELNEFGYIKNWPEDFFGDELAERSAMLDAMIARKQTANAK